MLSLASSSSESPGTPKSTTSRQEDLRAAASSHGTDTSGSTQRPLSDAATANINSSMVLETKQRPDLDLSSSPPDPDTHSPTSPHTQPSGPPTTPTPGVTTPETSQRAVQPVIRATDELCHVIGKHLSQRDVIASASTSTAAASAGRRMLPIVPGTSTLAGPGLVVVGPGSSVATLRCQSARAADCRSTISRHVSLMCFPLTQRSNEV